MIDEGTRRDLLHNSLVFVGPPENHADSLQAVSNLQKIALGSPRSVPAGRYAEQALTAAGLYPQMLAGNRLVPAKDVRQALFYADRGEVDGAFVYRTDALLAKLVQIQFEVPQELYPRITYPAALMKSAAGKPEARDIFEYLFSPAAHQVFVKYGFVPPW